jgi:hypothetical protein
MRLNLRSLIDLVLIGALEVWLLVSHSQSLPANGALLFAMPLLLALVILGLLPEPAARTAHVRAFQTKVLAAGIGAFILFVFYDSGLLGLKLLGLWTLGSAAGEGILALQSLALVRSLEFAIGRGIVALVRFLGRLKSGEVLFEAGILAAIAAGFQGYMPGSLPARALWLAPAAWVAISSLVRPFLGGTSSWRARLGTLGVWIIVLACALHASCRPGVIAGLIYAACLSLGLAHAVFHALYRGTRIQGEWLHWLLVLATASWVLHPFVYDTLHGAADALWYATLQSDAVAQARQGIYPVLNGQGIAQFDGAVYPFRIAPAVHNLAIWVDHLTLRSLAPIAIQNLMLFLVGLAGFGLAYVALSEVLGRRSIVAVLAATLLLTCPGVIGILYNTDLYMSWTTVPLIPLVWLGFIGCFRSGNPRASALLWGAALGATWWGHSPIAMWHTAIGGIGAVGLAFRHRRNLRALATIYAVAGAAFLATSVFPILSVEAYPPEASIDASGFQRADPGNVVYFLNQAFPKVFEPLSDLGRALSDFQFGYSLLLLMPLVLLLAPWRSLRSRGLLIPFALLCLAWLGIATLLTPFPTLSLKFWTWVPAIIRNTTGNWVMNRLYLVGSGALLFSVAVAASAERRIRIGLAWLGLAMVAYTLSQVGRFIYGSDHLRPAPGSGVKVMRPENIYPSRFAYIVFPKMPPTFNHGVVDPLWEHRILSPDGTRVIDDNASAALRAGTVVLDAPFVPPPAGQIVWHLDAKVHLDPGTRYVGDFLWATPVPQGVAQFLGPSMNRVYAIPDYGEALSFGAGGDHRHWLSLFTSAEGGEDLQVLFHANAGVVPASVGRMRLLSYPSDRLPVRVASWIRYRATVTSPEAGLLEIPRMYQDRYSATVNQSPVHVTKSPFGMTAVPIPSGTSEVRLFEPRPAALVAAFWFSLVAILVLVPYALVRVVRENATS